LINIYEYFFLDRVVMKNNNNIGLKHFLFERVLSTKTKQKNDNII